MVAELGEAVTANINVSRRRKTRSVEWALAMLIVGIVVIGIELLVHHER
jgi:hypothetical protein